MTIKRTLSIIIVLLLMMSLCACGKSDSYIIVSSNPVATATSTTFTTVPSTVPTSTPATAPATVPTTEVTTAPATQPTHVHIFSNATCSDPQTCMVCGTTSGTTVDHSFFDGKCLNCGEDDPDFNSETMIWIPTKGGKKYHTYAGCSNMIDPDNVTLSQAEALGFTPCKRCH